MAQTITDQNFQNLVLDNKGLVLVDFWAPWCGPCRIQGPIVDDLARQYAGKDNIIIGSMNVDENPRVAQDYQIMSIPTLKFFKNGQVMADFVGVQSKEVLEQKINQLAA